MGETFDRYCQKIADEFFEMSPLPHLVYEGGTGLVPSHASPLLIVEEVIKSMSPEDKVALVQEMIEAPEAFDVLEDFPRERAMTFQEMLDIVLFVSLGNTVQRIPEVAIREEENMRIFDEFGGGSE